MKSLVLSIVLVQIGWIKIWKQKYKHFIYWIFVIHIISLIWCRNMWIYCTELRFIWSYVFNFVIISPSTCACNKRFPAMKHCSSYWFFVAFPALLDLAESVRESYVNLRFGERYAWRGVAWNHCLSAKRKFTDEWISNLKAVKKVESKIVDIWKPYTKVLYTQLDV